MTTRWTPDTYDGSLSSFEIEPQTGDVLTGISDVMAGR